MNLVQSIQRKYLPGFYQSRYTQRKRLALSLKDKCIKDPTKLTLYQLRIILKVLQQFDLLTSQPQLTIREQNIKKSILQNSVYSALFSMLPFGVRQFHRVKILKRLFCVGVLFTGLDYILMREEFTNYIQQCRTVAQRQVHKLLESSSLPM